VGQATVAPTGGGWQATFSAADIGTGTFIVHATCLGQSYQCPDGSVVPDLNLCGEPVRCGDGTQAPSHDQCPEYPCPDGSSDETPTSDDCPTYPCPDGSVVQVPGTCPTTTTAVQVSPEAAAAAPVPVEAAGPFNYESVTLVVTNGAVSGSPGFTG
jgi:hypothetical protein